MKLLLFKKCTATNEAKHICEDSVHGVTVSKNEVAITNVYPQASIVLKSMRGVQDAGSNCLMSFQLNCDAL